MRPELRVYHDEDGRELFDVEDGLLPPPDAPAPVRFLPEYDDVLLSHSDRRRVTPSNHKPPIPPGNGARRGTVLIDGFMRAEWLLEVQHDTARVRIEHDAALTKRERSSVFAEAKRLLGFLLPTVANLDVDIRRANGS